MKLFGIDYKTWMCGGIGNARLAPWTKEIEIFYTESEMLKRIAKLKDDNAITDIVPFITYVKREKYEI